MAIDLETSGDPSARERVLTTFGDLRGKPVQTRDGDKLGTIDQLIVDARTGQIEYVILSTGGFLGLGQSYHPVPWSAFVYDDTLGGYAAAIDKRLLEGSPGFRPDTAPTFDESYGRRVSDYYRSAPNALA